MILEEETFEKYGYYSTDLTPKSHKKIVAVCDDCGKVRILSKDAYHSLCHSCAVVRGENSPFWQGGLVMRICEQCGVEFPVYPSKVKRGGGKFCSPQCTGKWMTKHRVGKNSANWQGGMVMRICEFCGMEFPVYPSAIKNGGGRFCSPKCQGRWWSKIQKGKSMAHLRAKQHQKPSKPERIFQEICQKNNIPFHYVGDGQLWIGKRKKMNPDFIEANGKKICVEIMGAWWHSRLLNQKVREDALLPYREKHYKHYKWQPIFIWDSDLLRKDAETFVLNELRKEGI